MSLFVAKRLGLVAAVAIAVGACSPQSSAAPQAQSTAPALTQSQESTAAPPVGTLNGRALPDFANLVEQVGPAVVNVEADSLVGWWLAARWCWSKTSSA